MLAQPTTGVFGEGGGSIDTSKMQPALRARISGVADLALNTEASSGVQGASMPPPTQFLDAQGASLFWGDYAGLAIRGDTAFPIWSDTREPDVFICPGTATPGHPGSESRAGVRRGAKTVLRTERAKRCGL